MTESAISRARSRQAAARDQADAAPVTVRQILATRDLADAATIAGGASGLDRVVRDAVVGTLGDPLSETAVLGGALIVLDSSRARSDSYQIDLALRSAVDSGASGVVLCGPRTMIALAAVRFADKIGVPLVVVQGLTPLTVSDLIRRIVRDPLAVRSRVILDVLQVLQHATARESIDGVVVDVSELVNADLALIGTDGTVLSGATEGSPPDPRRLLEVPTAIVEGPYVYVTHPLSLAVAERPSYWMSARLTSPTASWQSVTADALGLVAWFLTSRLVADRLQRERDARFRLGVLNAIVSGQDRPEPVLLEHLAVLGWQVDGWCTGIHLQASGDVDPLRILTLTDELNRQLHAAGVRGPLIERPDGWTVWTVAKDEPVAAATSGLVRATRWAVERFTSASPRLRLHVGIGRPSVGIAGLRTSLAESKEAATIAQAAGEVFGVQHIDEMGVRRILLGWYASDSFAEFAHTLLGPLLSVDADGQLLATLESYLDMESSATMAAAHLSVHRNTVLNRLDRLRALLTVNLDDPDERLAVQLACRVVKLKRAESQLPS